MMHDAIVGFVTASLFPQDALVWAGHCSWAWVYILLFFIIVAAELPFL